MGQPSKPRQRQQRREWRSATLHDVEELRGVVALFDEVWSTAGAPPIGLEHLIALAHAGSYVGGAYDGDELLGASVAFLAAPIGEALHSDVTGVVERARDRRLGFAIKLHQRAWALNNGLSRIRVDVRPAGPAQRLLQPRQAWR